MLRNFVILVIHCVKKNDCHWWSGGLLLGPQSRPHIFKNSTIFPFPIVVFVVVVGSVFLSFSFSLCVCVCGIAVVYNVSNCYVQLLFILLPFRICIV